MSLELITSCPICSGKVFEPYLEVKDHSVSHGTFQITKCKKCDLLLTNPRPPESEIGSYYDSETYISHHDEVETLMSKVYNQVRKITVEEKTKLIKKYDNELKKELLDIGCGTGFFLSACKEKGWAISGTEPDPDARNLASKRTKINIEESIFSESLDNKLFPIITMWHVLEHVHRLDETMIWLHKHLQPKGTLFIAVPNAESYDSKVFGKHWAAYDVPRHLYHFTKTSMEKLLHHHNFEIADIKPMLFDSYYVSLLSNTYQYGNNRPIKSFITGSISNIKGYGTNQYNTNTSSIIYVVRKK